MRFFHLSEGIYQIFLCISAKYLRLKVHNLLMVLCINLLKILAVIEIHKEAFSKKFNKHNMNNQLFIM